VDWFGVMWIEYEPEILITFFIIIGVIVVIIFYYLRSRMVDKGVGEIVSDKNGYYWRYNELPTGRNWISKTYFNSSSEAEFDMRKSLKAKGVLIE